MAPVAAAFTRLDDLTREERCGQAAVAEAISLHLYGKHYDELPPSVRARVEGAALRALRSPQGAWQSEALKRAHLNLDRAIAQEMGPTFGMLAPLQRQALARVGVQAVLAALLGVFEVSHPFNGSGDALKVYEAAAAAAQEVR